MNRTAAWLTLLLASGAPAQGQQASKLKLRVDALLRQEWTRDIFVSSDQFKNESRRRARVLPRLELGGDRFHLGVGAELNYSSDKNVEPKPALLRDNYDSRDARLDLAFASLKPVAWLQVQGGRFAMPVGVTEMIWDRDLRPQGGALGLEAQDVAGFHRLAATALLAEGSHVFADEKARMLILSGEATFPKASEAKLTLTGSYVQFTHLGGLEGMIRRQNTRQAGAPAPAPLAKGYEIVDAVARFKREGKVTTQIVADYCWNTAADENNRGLWLALVLGSTQSAQGRLEYTYADVDKDATVAAYATDDFFWATGWEGHRIDLGVRASDRAAFHAVGQLQRFKDSPRAEEREHRVKRLRLELRISY